MAVDRQYGLQAQGYLANGCRVEAYHIARRAAIETANQAQALKEKGASARRIDWATDATRTCWRAALDLAGPDSLTILPPREVTDLLGMEAAFDPGKGRS